jgi:para-aminobenzoate synthetase/4-amino-4-deoxychorismate lyase
MAEPLARGRRWRLFERPRAELRADRVEDVVPVLEEAERERRRGAWMVGFLAYEAAAAFDEALVTRPSSGPLALWRLCDAPRELTDEEAWKWLGERAGTGASNMTGGWRSLVDDERYLAALGEVRDRIAAGDVYQVNLTFPLEEWHVRESGAAVGLFLGLDAMQRAPWAALIDGLGPQLCSASPELFFTRRGSRLMSKPMKGTWPRGRYAVEDLERAHQLEHSRKDRAENLMIVDMIRNDLGRIARPGSVAVERLFEIERYPTVHQMTSTVSAQSDASTPEILAALFPCASITGAPKVTAMRAIRDLEPQPRGVYTGTVGWVSPEGDATFNVAIRTAWRPDPEGPFRYGVGSGVVWDSEPRRELEECRVKARVLVEERRPFELLETLLWRPGSGFSLLREHLERMASSADFFGYPWDETEVLEGLEQAMVGSTERSRVRLLLDAGGRVRCEVAPAPPRRMIWRVRIDTEPIDLSGPWAWHKTTRREIYDEAVARAPADCDDVILWNERGELTETTRANLVLRLDGRWLTPPVEVGLLAGTLRRRLLERGRIDESRLTLDDLERAERAVLINSLRGVIRAELLPR